MPYTSVQLAEQFASEIAIVERIKAGAPVDEAFLIGQVLAHMRTVLDQLVDDIGSDDQPRLNWWQRLSARP